MSAELASAAARYAQRGLAVFPVKGKVPLTSRGSHDATTDLVTIRRWWTTRPEANIGLATGTRSGLVVLDVDGAEGETSLESLQAKNSLPKTLEARTGCGRHLYFYADGARIRNDAGKKLGSGLDVRGEGGYVVVPPSLHSSGKRYAWKNKMKPAPLPLWLAEMLAVPASRTASTNSDAPIRAGQRNTTLASLAGTMRRRGMTQAAIEAALVKENDARCVPPLSEGEVLNIARSIARYPSTSQSPNGQPLTMAASAVTRCFSDIVPAPLQWLWPGRIPLGKLTLLVGDPGQGKSLVTMDIASRESRGVAFPDGANSTAGDVILLNAEDDASDTIRPRLDAAGADVSRIHLLEAVRVTLGDGTVSESPFSLERDLEKLEDVLTRLPGARLLVIDPVSAYMGSADSNVNAEVRGLLAPLASLAARRAVAIIAVSHLRKSAGEALHRTIASIAFTAAPRAVWAVAPDPGNPARRVMVPVKQNLSANTGGLAFWIEASAGVPRIAWEPGVVNLDANQVLGGIRGGENRSARQEAEDRLHDLLATEPIQVEEVRRAAEAAGLSWRTVERAKAALGVEAERKGYGEAGGWAWRLPQTPPAKDRQPRISNLAAFDKANENTRDKVTPRVKDRQSDPLAVFEEEEVEL